MLRRLMIYVVGSLSEEEEEEEVKRYRINFEAKKCEIY